MPNAAPSILPADDFDATREFAAKLNDSRRWVVKKAIPVFKAHERTDPATGQLIKVDLPKLYRIANNMQKLERQGGVPIRMTLGHTEPNKSEPEQPPVGGYYKNARVQPFGPKGEPAIVVDEWLDPQYASVRKNYPYRSAEYYDDAEQITGVALLTRDPFLDLGVVAYERGDSLVCYTTQSEPDRRLNYHRNGQRAPVLYHLVIGEVPPVNYGNWQGAARGAVDGGITGARLGAGKGPYGAAVGGVAGAAVGGYQGWHQQPTQNARFAARYAEENDGIDEDQYSPEDVARMRAEQSKHDKNKQQNQSQQDADREALESRRDRRKPPPFSTYANQGPNMPNAQYSAPWPGPAHQRANIGHQHASAWRFADDQRSANYGVSSTLGGAAGGATLGMMAGGPVGAVAGGLAGGAGGALMGSRYANSGYGRGRPGRYAEEMPGGPPPGGPGDMGGGPPGGGDPLQQLQMLLMGAVEILGQLTGGGGGGMGPGGPPPGAGGPPPGPPQGPFPGEEEEQYARYAAQQRYAQQGQRRAPQRPAGYGRQPGRYAGDGTPVPYGYPAQPRTISGKPVGESMAVSQLNYQLQQQGQVIKMLAYERDQADSEACIEAIQRLADQGYPVSEYEVGELKSKSRDQRGAYLNHIATHYQKIGTEQMPQVLGDPTPVGPDPNMGRPTTKEEMEAALKIAAGSPNDPTAYNKALQQVRYGRENPAQYGANRIAGYPQGLADANPLQQAEWTSGQQQPGFNPGNPYGEPSTNGQY